MTNNTVPNKEQKEFIMRAQYLHDFGYNIIITYNKSVSDAKKLARSLNNKRADSCKIIRASFSSKTNFKNCLKTY